MSALPLHHQPSVHQPSVDLRGRMSLVTGGNSGIGFEVARRLLARGSDVALLCRDASRGSAAVDALAHATGRRPQLVVADLSLYRSLHAAESTLRALGPIDILVNNAGVWRTDRRLTSEGLEETFATNVLGPMRLTRLLDAQLQPRTRIVNIASWMYRMGRLDLERLPKGDHFDPIRTYADSHLCIALWTKGLAEQLADRGVSVHVSHPGTVQSNLSKSATGFLGWLYRVSERLTAISAEQGSIGPVFVATASELDATTGEYFAGTKRQPLKGRGGDARNVQRFASFASTYL